MASYYRNDERKKIIHDFRRREEDVVTSLCRLGSRPTSPKSLVEEEKRIRREIANSNERRRMQSINAGFQSLRSLLPHREGEKLSKAAILQNTADYINQLEREKVHLLEQYCQLKRSMLNSQSNQDSDSSCPDSPLPKRKKGDTADSIEITRSLSPSRSETSTDDEKPEIIQLKLALEQERNLRLMLEKQVTILETQLFCADSVPKVKNQPYLQCHNGTENLPKTLTSVVTVAVKKNPSSPQTDTSIQETNNSQEGYPGDSLCKISSEVPKDLSGKNCSVLLPCVSELSLSDAAASPVLLLSPNSSVSSAQTETRNSTEGQVEYKASTCRQNLETIVEAIRLVEGGHMFRDDSSSSESETKVHKQYEEQNQQASHKFVNTDFSLQHQIIRIAPVVQSRPGVIVSNHS